MNKNKQIKQTPAWLLTADRYIAEITHRQRATRWCTVAGHSKVGKGLPKPFLMSHADWLNATAPSLLQ